ncbi:MAG: hypothetical protein ACK4L7_10295 [Flavobacteriales bacterium]
MRYSLLLSAFALGMGYATAQHHSEESGKEAEVRHQLAFFSGHSWVPQGRNVETGRRQSVLAPTFGIDYAYQLSERWTIGTYNDLEVLNILVDDREDRTLERENVVVLTLGAAFEFAEHWCVELGGGVETDRHGTLRVGRMALERGFPLRGRWHLGLVLSYVNKDLYDTLGIGLAIGPRF